MSKYELPNLFDHIFKSVLQEALTDLNRRYSQNLVSGSTIGEVEDAREGEITLRDNLRRYATKEDLGLLADGSPKGFFTTFSNLQNAHPNGAPGIFVVTATGNWYYWSGSDWVSGGAYQSTEWLDALTTSGEDWSV